jgi:hypothetical protein
LGTSQREAEQDNAEDNPDDSVDTGFISREQGRKHDDLQSRCGQSMSRARREKPVSEVNLRLFWDTWRNTGRSARIIAAVGAPDERTAPARGVAFNVPDRDS